jgi:hypothetical protein
MDWPVPPIAGDGDVIADPYPEEFDQGYVFMNGVAVLPTKIKFPVGSKATVFPIKLGSGDGFGEYLLPKPLDQGYVETYGDVL